MHLAVKLAYNGSRFHGSQRQGDDDEGSVEGSVAAALRKVANGVDWSRWPLNFSSRTDAGVSALGNVFSLETDMDPDELLRALNANLMDIWCWGWGTPRPGQNMRWATSRWYRYHLPPVAVAPDRLNDLNDVLSRFVGEHDFSHLCRLEEEKNPVTVIESAKAYDLSGNGELIVVDIVGSRFLWNQVRRMVGAALGVVEEDLTADDLAKLIDGARDGMETIKTGIRTMPPTGLVLMDVHFKDIDFRISDEALKVALERNKEMAWEASIRVLLHTAMRSMYND
ncbi:MAG: hypothetical protein ACMUHY_03400 [Thermoplasmatota archaeon]